MNFKFIADTLRSFADNIDAGNTNVTEAELLELCEMVGALANPEDKLSKYQVAKLLGVNHKTVDYYVQKGYIPKGRQEVGFKEIFWYKKDILKYKAEKDGTSI